MTEDELSFKRAEYEPSTRCALCRSPLADTEFRVNGAAACAVCAAEAQRGPGTPVSRLVGALGVGAGAAAVSALVWWGIRALTGYEIGLIAIGIGFLVGVAVKSGAAGRGGLPYQVLAMVLVYGAIALSYVPDLASAIATPPEVALADGANAASTAPVHWVIAWGVAVPFALALPFIVLFDDPGSGLMGLIIIGIALYEAWKINQPQRGAVVEGPFPTAPPRPEDAPR